MNSRRRIKSIGILFVSFVLLLFAVAPSDSLRKRSSPSENTGKTGVANSLQILVVTTKNWDDLHGIAQRYERSKWKSKWNSVGPAFAVVVGKTGLGWGRGIQPDTKGAADGPIKHEGAGKRPPAFSP
jgi:hypothetical protein